MFLALALTTSIMTACDSNSNVEQFIEAEEVAALGLSTLRVSSEVSLVNAAETAQFNVSGENNDGAEITDLDSKVTWKTSNEGLATVDASGLVTAVADGVVTISAGYAFLEAQSTLTINTADLVQINLSGDSLIDECKSSAVTTSGIFSDGSTRVIADGLSFSVSDSSVVSLDSASNSTTLLTHKPGVVTVEATKNEIVGTLDVEVADALQELLISPLQADVSVGNTISYAATGVYAGSETVDITPSSVWTSIDSDIAAFNSDSNGVLSGIAEGSSSIVAACGEMSVNAVVRVNAVSLYDVKINYGSESITLDEDDDGYQLTLRAIYSDDRDGSGEDVTDDADWSNITNASGNIVVNDDDSDKGELAISGTGSAYIRAEFEGESATILIIVE